MSPIRSLSIILALALPPACKAQIVLVGLPHSPDNKTISKSNARTKALELPIWDDFSATRTTFANPDVWFAGKSIRVNDGMAIRPPSVGVATFDGVDSVGRPYNVTDILAKGYADKLESLAIDLTTVDVSERSTLYLSFAYQMQGRGESPDSGDRLLVSFKDSLNAWIPMVTIENDGTLQPDLFYSAIIPVSDQRFFHSGFKFRIQNFARLSGPYDTWNVDYIYLNRGRTANDVDFPDRTISEPLTNLFGLYRILPIKHFQLDPIVTAPSILATNLNALDRQGDPNIQPYNFSSTAYITSWLNNVPGKMPMQLDIDDKNDGGLQKGVYTTVSLKHLPDLAALSFQVDSMDIELLFSINTRDNAIIDPEGDGPFPLDPLEGDYDPAKYDPIDFRYNDTTRASYHLLNKYAYDDGVPEYGAGLNQPGAQLAYEYNLVGVSEGYVSYMEMHFPKFGDESSQVIELRIWDDLANEPVYTQVVSLQRSEAGEFWVQRMIDPVPVKKKFYVGWKQSSAAVIAVGLDKNTDTGDKMQYNTNGEWIPNTLVHGSLMLRPIFGAKSGGTDGLEDEKTLTVYPNPSSGSFRFGGVADRVLVYDMAGRSVGFQSETTTDETIVTLPNASQGIYILRAYIDGAIRTAKVMVR